MSFQIKSPTVGNSYNPLRMHPEASRIASRLLTALKGESGGLDTAKLAWQYAIAIENANQRIAQASATLAEDDLIGCYLVAKSSPDLMDTVATLDIAESEQWAKRCQDYEWKVPAKLDLKNAAKIKTKIEQIDDPKKFLYTEYRNRIRAKQPFEAYPIISLLAQDNKDDPNTIEECKRLKTQLIGTAEAKLAASATELIPAKSIQELLASYRSLGLPLEESDGTLDTVLASEKEAIIQQAIRQIQETTRIASEIENEGDWKAAETIYLACDYFLAVTGTRGEIAPELRDEFEKAGTVIAHKRYGSESIVRLRIAIDDTKGILAGQHVAPKAAGRRSSRPSLADSVERLKSAETQTRKLGNRIPVDLQREIAATLKAARRKKLPKLIIMAAAAVAILFGGLWSVSNISGNSQKAESEATAYKEILAAKSTNRTDSIQQALDKFSREIANADSDSDLKRDAKALKAWKQRQLQQSKDYAAIAEALEQLDEDETGKRIQLIEDGHANRLTLASDLGIESEQRIAAAKNAHEQKARQREGEYRKQIKVASDQARSYLQDAAVADSKTAFRTLASKAGRCIFEAEKLAQDSGLQDQIKQTQQDIEEIRQEVATLESNWEALGSTANKLATITSLDEYTKELIRIQNFDVLPNANKNDIERILRNDATSASVKQQLLMPDDASGWASLTQAQDYRNDEPQVSDVERVFIQRLANDPFFETIYQSKVKYFEGSPVARSEYTAFLFDPVRKTETGVRTGVNYNFQIRGFDENGEPESESREMNFLSHPDGTFWGFFYEPSSLSRESQYYEQTIRVQLLKVLSGAPRFTLVNLIDQITASRGLSPAFRAYWHQQLFSFMKMNPWKWGMPLSPTLQKQSKELTQLARGEISKRLWLSTIEQSAPSLELTEYFRIAGKTDIAAECRAFASLYKIANEGDFAVVGHVTSEGDIKKQTPSHPNNSLWAINPLSGQVESLDTLKQPAPYSPILHYTLEDKPASHALQKTQFLTGTNLAVSPYKKTLPPLFDSIK